jgi:hypothetical protein
VAGNKVTVQLKLFKGEKQFATCEVTGAQNKPNELATSIVVETEKHLGKQKK